MRRSLLLNTALFVIALCCVTSSAARAADLCPAWVDAVVPLTAASDAAQTTLPSDSRYGFVLAAHTALKVSGVLTILTTDGTYSVPIHDAAVAQSEPPVPDVQSQPLYVDFGKAKAVRAAWISAIDGQGSGPRRQCPTLPTAVTPTPQNAPWTDKDALAAYPSLRAYAKYLDDRVASVRSASATAAFVRPDAQPSTPPSPCATPFVPVEALKFPGVAEPRAAAPPGLSLVRVVVDPSGTPTDATIALSSGNGARDAVALRAARATTYSPSLLQCEPVFSSYLYFVTFPGRTLRGAPSPSPSTRS